MPLLRGKQTILLPVNPLFVKGSIAVAFLVNLILGKASLYVNVLDAVLFFWCLRENRIVKSGSGFGVGLAIDFYFNRTIGQSALCYTITALFANFLSGRFLSIPMKAQAFLLFALLMLKNMFTMILLIVLSDRTFSFDILVSPIISGFLYPLLLQILLSPQLKPTSSEETPI